MLIKNINELKEELAAIEHARWSHWQKYLHGKCIRNHDGSLTIPKELVEKWEHQSNIEFSELNEVEKDSDREQVDKYLPLLISFINSS